MQPSMADVARLAGVSKATVSNVLNRRAKASEEVRQRVLSACESLDYRLNAGIQELARAGLNNGRTGSIGFVVAGEAIADPYTSRFMDGIAEGAREQNQHLFMAKLTGKETSVYDLPAGLRDRRVDGILVTGQLTASMDMIRRLEVPFVVLGNYAPDVLRGAVTVEFDYDSGFGMLAQRLKAAGKRRIAYISKTFEFYSERQEHAAFRRALETHGLPVLPDLEFIGGGSFVDIMELLTEAMDRDELPFDAVFFHDFKASDEFVHLWLGRNWRKDWNSDVLLATSRPFDYYRLPVPALYMDIRSDALARTGIRVLMDILEGRAPDTGHRTLVHLDVTCEDAKDERYRYLQTMSKQARKETVK